MRPLLLIPLLLCALTARGAEPSPAADPEPAARQAATELLVSTGMDRSALQVLELAAGQIRSLIAMRLPPAEVRRITDELILPALRQRSGELTRQIAEIWARQYSVAELQQLRSFYETPVGRKTVQMLPGIIAHAQTVGLQWGQTVILDVVAANPDAFKGLGLDLAK